MLTALTVFALYTAIADARAKSSTRGEICRAFGRWCNQAIRVSSCETGGTFDIYARNGRYWGLFQVSDHWRRTIPGFAWNARAQSEHAFRVFKITGYSWRHWECQP
jgi:hypothetical protein